ncbi:MAG: class I SAM-dependent methyltransferase [Bacteriovoracaceae bacterium]|nr:class I SAM-dependent methyltransferase [Bacteriovoracaceae bacterium]
MSSTVKCRVCGENTNFLWDNKLLGKYVVKYYQCPKCQYVMTEEPYWIEEAYSKSINLSDTGYLVRNLLLSNFVSILLFLTYSKASSFLDFAGGYGVFVRLMRDKGFNFYWIDKYTTNLFAVNFEWKEGKHVEAITAFEVFEHLVTPKEEIAELFKSAKTLIISTDLYQDKAPGKNWEYLGFDHGQHIGFYNKKTLAYVASQHNMRVYSYGGIHVFTRDERLSNFKFYLSKLLFKFKFHHLLKRFLESKTLSDSHQIKKESV